ncbi:MAG: ABC transporter substrate-binding protein [Chloroflexota bacterium]|nr:ABC transporter substrate-binding protein [Chloroflexota bacterium]
MKSKVMLLLALVWLGGLIACAPAPAPTAVPPTIAPTAAPKVKLTVAYSTLNPDPLPVWVAEDAGFFDQNGLDVTLTFINGGTQTAQAAVAGDVKFAVTAPSAAVNADAGGADLVLVTGLVNVINYDFLTLPGIKTAADMKGKKVAWSGPSGSSATALRIALKTLFSFTPDAPNPDVTAITIGTEPEREQAMVAKQIDATVMNPDLAETKGVQDGLVVFAQMWKRTDIPYQHTGIVASKKYLSGNADTATRFFKSVVQAIGYIRDPANKAAVIASLAKYLKSDDQAYLASGYTRMSQTLLQCAPYGTLDGMKTVIGESKTAVDKGITPDQMTDNSFIKALDDSGFVKANCK